MANEEPSLGERLLARYDRLPGRTLTREERGYTWPAELDNQQHPDWPEGWTYARVFRELHGRTHIFTPEQRQALNDRIAGIRKAGEQVSKKGIKAALREQLSKMQLALVDHAYDDERKQRAREASRAHYAANRDQIREQQRAYYEANKEQIRERQKNNAASRKYRKANPGSSRERMRQKRGQPPKEDALRALSRMTGIPLGDLSD